MFTTIGLSTVAGILSILSPCVLPLVPIVLGTAATEHKYGSVALVAGLALSFTVVGLFVATIGFSIGLDFDVFRNGAAVVMIIIGAFMAITVLQGRLASVLSPLTQWLENKTGGTPKSGLAGQFGIGAILGVVWTPCVGPTLGAAALLASQGKDLFSVAITMLAFGIGAGIPMLLIGMLSREALVRWRSRMMATGSGLKKGIGILLAVVGVLILSGLDKRLETFLVEASPAWLTALTTSI